MVIHCRRYEFERRELILRLKEIKMKLDVFYQKKDTTRSTQQDHLNWVLDPSQAQIMKKKTTQQTCHVWETFR